MGINEITGIERGRAVSEESINLQIGGEVFVWFEGKMKKYVIVERLEPTSSLSIGCFRLEPAPDEWIDADCFERVKE